MRLHRAFKLLALCLAILLPVQGYAMNARCDAARQAVAATPSNHCDEHGHSGGTPTSHECAHCCGAVVGDATLRLTPLHEVACRITASSAVTPPHLARERLDRPPRLS